MTRSSDFEELKVLLRRGRRDYDHVAGVVYAACHNDPQVLQKILAANPEDAPSSDSENGASSDKEYPEEENDDDDGDGEVSREDNEAQSIKQSGSKDDPVVLDSNVKSSGSKESGKRKRTTTEAKDRSLTKKHRHLDALLLCLSCGEKFNPEKNKPRACHFHPAESALSELEDDPTCEDIMDDEDSRETWPNAFEWVCCGTNLEENEPCENGRHRPDGGSKTEYAARREKERRRKKYFG